MHYKNLLQYLQTKFNIDIDIYVVYGKKAEHCTDSMQYLIADQYLVFISDNSKKFPIKNVYMYAKNCKYLYFFIHSTHLVMSVLFVIWTEMNTVLLWWDLTVDHYFGGKWQKADKNRKYFREIIDIFLMV